MEKDQIMFSYLQLYWIIFLDERRRIWCELLLFRLICHILCSDISIFSVTTNHAAIKVTESTNVSHSDVWYEHSIKFLTCTCMILCIVLLPQDWLIRWISSRSEFLIKWPVSVCVYVYGWSIKMNYNSHNLLYLCLTEKVHSTISCFLMKRVNWLVFFF